MLSREQLAQEYINIINQYYPMAGRLLSHCLVKIIKLNSTYNRTYYYNLGIYYPDRIGRHLLEQQDVFRDIQGIELPTILRPPPQSEIDGSIDGCWHHKPFIVVCMFTYEVDPGRCPHN